jgi:hypothetical protein
VRRGSLNSARPVVCATLIILALLAVTGCGSVSRMASSSPSAGPGQPSVPPGAPTPDPGGPTFLTVVLKPGADPSAVAHRITGPEASVHQVLQRRQENLPRRVLASTYRVDLVKGHELEALRKATADPDVQQAYLGEYPGQYPEPSP